MSAIAPSAVVRAAFAFFVAVAVCAVPAPAAAERQKDTIADSEEATASPRRIAELIEQLGDEDYFARQEAQRELAELGFEAFEALNEAATHDDLEIAYRARYLLRLLRVDLAADNDPPKVKECLKDYDSKSADDRLAQMQILAQLPDDAGVDALCRLVRFEKSSALSKAAATALLTRAGTSPPSEAAVLAVRKHLAKSRRPGAVWLTAWTQFGEKPRASMLAWNKIVDDELEALQDKPADSSPAVVSALLRFQADWWTEMGEDDSAARAIRRLISLEQGGDSESIAELLDWLIERKAWTAIDDLAERRSSQFDADPRLLYILAEAYAAQGEGERASQTAERALQLNPGKQPEHLQHHFQAAQLLCMRGQWEWARREYEHIIEQCDKTQLHLMVFVSARLAELLYDQNDNLAAAKALEKAAQAIDAEKNPQLANVVDIRKLRGRMHYMYACHWRDKQDVAKQREALDKALLLDSGDVDSLIAAHQLPGQPPKFREKIADLVEQTTDEFQKAIDEDPESASAYNQYAWLAGNTDGDLDKALKYSLKSLELEPGIGGYYDTLAHVYFAKGDYKKAVEAQTKAVELDPHSGAIRRALDRFQKKLKEEEQKK